MRNHILQVIGQIEKEYEVTVLFACESGSRAWGFPSKNSDYDVRFIYVHKMDWYLSIDQKRDVLEVPKHDSLSIPVDELLDVSGWELTKALRLFRKSNPPLLEWLRSGIVYYQAYSTIEKMRALNQEIFAPVTGISHYLNMAKGNYRDYLQGENVRIKKYFYVLRPLLAAKWIEKYRTFPPIEFQRLLDEILPSGNLKEEIEQLLVQKMAGEELDQGRRIEVLNTFIEGTIQQLENFAKAMKIEIVDPTKQLDQLFRDTLSDVWK